MTIRILDGLTVSQIAAGEVVAGPASAVKELVENSVDAGAARVAIALRAGGRSLIEVVDDGAGMSPGEVELALRRHATSKITTAADLESVTTFGFRGEALPSIASVSRLDILSRRHEAAEGWMMTVEGAEAGRGSQCAHPPGTTVRVRDLFFNTPARASQLRSPARELTSVLRTVTALALSRPGVAFTVSQGGRQLLRTTGSGDLAVTYMDLFGRERSRDMVKLGPVSERGISVSGLVGRPALAGGSRIHQHFLVNGRPVRAPVVARAVSDALRPHVGDGGHVPAVLVLDVDPGMVDVNVHPAKSEVRLSDDSAAYRVTRRAIEMALGTVPRGTRPNVAPPALAEAAAAAYPADAATAPGTGTQGALWDSAGGCQRWTAVGSLFDTYIIATEGERAYIVDQHAAHERVVYDRLAGEWDRGGVPSQALVEPERVDLAPADIEFFRRNQDLLKRLGYRAEPFGGGSLLVRGVPAGSSGREMADLIDVLQEDRGDRLPGRQRAMLHLAACRASVMAGQRLSVPEMNALLSRLAATGDPATCPHGRPTVVELDRQEVERWFRRR